MYAVIASVAGLLIAFGLMLDVLSLAIGIRRLREKGPSGVPIIPLFFYFIGCTVLMTGDYLVASSSPVVSPWVLFLSLFVVHLLCQFIIPLILWLLLH